LRNNSQITLIKGFVTNKVNGSINSKISGPNGVVILPDRDELWVGDGDGTIKVISLLKNTITASINTGSKKRADEFAYDPKNGIVVVTNPNEDIPFVSVIGAANRTVLGKVMFPNVTELEQPVWNSASGLFYISVPSSGAFKGGFLSTLNIANMSIKATYGLPDCIPAGIVFGPNQHLFVGCSQEQILEFGYAASYVVNGADGSVIANISGLGGVDKVTYDPTANLYYASAYQMLANGSRTGNPMPVMGIVNASSNRLVQTIKTDNATAHSVAVDIKTGAMMVPIKAKGIQIFNLRSGVKGSGNVTSPALTPSQMSGAAALVQSTTGILALGIGLLSYFVLV
jgi:DNA-binding beta-propeller fold protein YncE